jgi:Obg family GTPase CgtA-like protein
VVAGTKADLVRTRTVAASLTSDALVVSGVSGEGIETLRERLAALAREVAEGEDERRPYVVIRPARPAFVVRREGERFRVVGRNVERWVAETDFDDPSELVRLQTRLIREVERQLAAEALAAAARS